jgi:hypothetical protein
MAVTTIDDSQVIMIDRFPGVANNIRALANFAGTPSGLIGWSDDPIYPVGTKVSFRDPDNDVESTFIYLKYMKGADHDIDLAAKDVVGVWDTTPLIYEVLNDGGEMLVGGPLAISINTLDYGVVFTTGGKSYQYGWFWCGGGCPASIKNAAGTKVLDGNFTIKDGSAAVAGTGLRAYDVAGAAAQLGVTVETDIAQPFGAYSLGASS